VDEVEGRVERGGPEGVDVLECVVEGGGAGRGSGRSGYLFRCGGVLVLGLVWLLWVLKAERGRACLVVVFTVCGSGIQDP
jgi:hypothetical protein